MSTHESLRIEYPTNRAMCQLLTGAPYLAAIKQVNPNTVTTHYVFCLAALCEMGVPHSGQAAEVRR